MNSHAITTDIQTSLTVEAHALSVFCPVTLWRFPLDLPDYQREPLRGLLSPTEKARADRFVFEVHRHRFVCAHALLRILLGRALEQPPETLEFDQASRGKPALTEGSQALRPLGKDPLHFNLSHSGDWGLLGIAWGRALGVDIEARRATSDLAALARRCFSPTELDSWTSLPESLRLEGFFLAWTRKEAFIKATGEGLHRELRSFTVSLDPREQAELRETLPETQERERWRLLGLEAPSGFEAALCLEARPGDPITWQSPTVQEWRPT